MIAILSLILVIACSMLITKVAAIALVHTGMERERAKFQARSAFTGAGFTTSESEQVVKHPVRRKIIMTLLLLGNAGFVTAISSLIIGFTNTSNETHLKQIYLLLGGILFLYLITRSKRLERMLDKLIVKLLVKFTDLRPRNFERLMTIMDDYEVMEVAAEDNTWLTGSTLADLKLTEEGVLVLGIVQGNGSYNGVPRGGYEIKPEDKLIMYGQAEQIENISKRRDKLQGKMEHKLSKAEFEEKQKEQNPQPESGLT
ncbi:MAG: TrkA C-terminal domain-containing protein [Kiritimatiellia bacterium]